jgi:hypothetical protein
VSIQTSLHPGKGLLQLRAKKAKPSSHSETSAAYSRIIGKIFFRHYRKGAKSVDFSRDEIGKVASELKIATPKNLGDVLYSFRYRRPLPSGVLATSAKGEEWVIKSTGAAKYSFRAVPITRIEPQKGRYQIKVPDATPEIVAQHKLSDEQALLAKLRYNRLVDIFTGLTTYSLQNHLRTQIEGVQIEIDELYVGIGKTGEQYIIPIQAKGGTDRLGRIQLEQDLTFCKKRFGNLTCRPVAAQFMDADVIAMFELTIIKNEVRVVEERHYKLVPATEISAEDLETMRQD